MNCIRRHEANRTCYDSQVALNQWITCSPLTVLFAPGPRVAHGSGGPAVRFVPRRVKSCRVTVLQRSAEKAASSFFKNNLLFYFILLVVGNLLITADRVWSKYLVLTKGRVGSSFLFVGPG